jgi:dihydroorotate dehydrogenase
MSKVATDFAADYRATVRATAALADFIVLNVSSPNTPGLRELQDVEAITTLIAAVRAELEELDLRTPLLLKISPDLDDREIDAIAETSLELQIDGIIAGNTTTSRTGLRSPADVASTPGGLSGPPLQRRALEVLRRLSARTGGELVLVSVGGIETADDALERIRAGATLVEAHTGFVYGGPLWPHTLNQELAARVRSAGASSIEVLIGEEAASRSHRDEHDAVVATRQHRTARPARAL